MGNPTTIAQCDQRDWGHTVLWESREAGGTSPEEAGGLPRGGGLWAEVQSVHRSQPGQGYSWQRLQPGRGLRLSWGTECGSRMCNGWAIGPLIALKAGHRDLGGVRWHADSRWNVTCFCFTENSLSLGLGLRVFFGNPRTGWGLVCLSQSRMEREDRWGQEVTWAQIVPEAQCPFGSGGCQVLAFSIWPSWELTTLGALKNSHICPLGSTASPVIYYLHDLPTLYLLICKMGST